MHCQHGSRHLVGSNLGCAINCGACGYEFAAQIRPANSHDGAVHRGAGGSGEDSSLRPALLYSSVCDKSFHK
jgi:hypothetical protein